MLDFLIIGLTRLVNAFRNENYEVTKSLYCRAIREIFSVYIEIMPQNSRQLSSSTRNRKILRSFF
jgi:hypothetical protein